MAGGTIGLIDDEGAVRRGVTRLLEAYGYRVEPFASADAFLQAGTAASLHCILIDLSLPGITGLDLYDRLTLAGCHVPVIFISGQIDAQTTGVSGRRAPVAVLGKPFDEGALLTAIGAAMALARRQTAPTLP